MAQTMKLIRKRPRAPRWTQKLAKVIKGWLEEEPEVALPSRQLAQHMWKVILDCNMVGKIELRSKLKEERQKPRFKQI